MRKNLFQIDAEAFIIQQMLEESDGEITPEIAEKMQLNTEEREAKAEGYCYVIKEFEAKIEMLAEEINRLAGMKKQYEKYCTELKNRLLESVQTIGAIKTGRVSISTRKSKAVFIAPDADLPMQYLRVKVEPNKAAIKEALEAGAEIAGAEIVENYSLIIK